METTLPRPNSIDLNLKNDRYVSYEEVYRAELTVSFEIRIGLDDFPVPRATFGLVETGIG
jgi:hypothetical protein